MKINKLAMVMFGGLMLCGCAVPQLPSQQAEQLTVAKAQREIKVGMTSAQVVEALGSPNMVPRTRNAEKLGYMTRFQQTYSTQRAKGVFGCYCSALVVQRDQSHKIKELLQSSLNLTLKDE